MCICHLECQGSSAAVKYFTTIIALAKSEHGRQDRKTDTYICVGWWGAIFADVRFKAWGWRICVWSQGVRKHGFQGFPGWGVGAPTRVTTQTWYASHCVMIRRLGTIQPWYHTDLIDDHRMAFKWQLDDQMRLGIFRSNGLCLAVTLQCHLRPAEAKKRHRVKSVVFEAFYFRFVFGIGGRMFNVFG